MPSGSNQLWCKLQINMAMSPLYHSTCLLRVIYNNINTDIDTTTLTGKGILLTFQRSNFTAHVEIPVGPFALIRAISRFNPSKDSHWLLTLRRSRGSTLHQSSGQSLAFPSIKTEKCLLSHTLCQFNVSIKSGVFSPS